MPLFADILPVVGRSIPLLLTYAVPEGLAGRLEAGAQVLAPLGERTVCGYVVSLHDNPPTVGVIKAIDAILEAPPAFSKDEIALAKWMAEYYCCSVAEALRPFLSEVGAAKIRRALLLTDGGKERIADSSEEQDADILAALRFIEGRKGKCSRPALAQLLGAGRAAAVLRKLKEQGLVEETAQLISSGKRKTAEFVSFAIDVAAARSLAQELSKRSPKQAAALNYLIDRLSETQPEMPLSEAAKALGGAAPIRALARKGVVTLRKLPLWRIPWPEADTNHPPTPVLTPQQQIAAEEILLAVKEKRRETFLLFGVTGSGKTEIFLLATQQALEIGKQALLLVPEISLTAQVVGLLRSRFGEAVAVLHSGLSAGERRDEKERIRLGEARVAVGPRSALFAPFRELGLVVVDEEHDASYKQEQAPHYHGRDVALKLAEQFHCPCILAGATPSLESFYLAEKGIYRLLRLEERPEGRPLPRVHLLDLRGQSKRPDIPLPELQQALTDCLQAEGQAIIFLNRRGHSTFLFCPLCGEAFRCPHCQVALVFHRPNKQLRCHHCDYHQAAPTICPNCQGTTLKFTGYGTQKVVEDLQQLFPDARISRMDRDTTGSKGAHLRYITDFREAATDMLVGTQMISKGLHFPGVTVVGVVAADQSLNMPDFRAAERTFQLLTQVAGRAGRGNEPGEVYIQTYHPEHFAIIAASNHDYEAFYTEELRQRDEANYPPFSYLANIVVSAPSAEAAQKHCQSIAEIIGEEIHDDEAEILGPAPAPLAKLKDRYRYHFLLRAQEPGVIQRVLNARKEQLGSRGKIHVVVDVDPVSLM